MSLSGHFEKVTVGWSENVDSDVLNSDFGFMCVAELINNTRGTGGVSSTLEEVLRSVAAVKIDPDKNKQLSIYSFGYGYCTSYLG